MRPSVTMEPSQSSSPSVSTVPSYSPSLSDKPTNAKAVSFFLVTRTQSIDETHHHLCPGTLCFADRVR